MQIGRFIRKCINYHVFVELFLLMRTIRENLKLAHKKISSYITSYINGYFRVDLTNLLKIILF